ncbi:unnamed protein product, partial [marine sediment metagenome]
MPHISEAPGASYTEAVADYLLTLRAAGCSEFTLNDRRRLLGRFGRHCGSRLGVSASDVATYLADLDISHNTLAQYASTLRLFFDHCIAQGWILQSPLATLPKIKQRGQQPVDPLTMDEIRRLLEAASPQQTDILLILLASGLRAGELASIREPDIDWVRGQVRVRGKGGKERTVALGERGREALRRQLGYL